MGYVQPARAEKAVGALKKMSAAHANVIRNGERENVAAADLVPGNIAAVRKATPSLRTRACSDRPRCTRRKPPSPARACPWRKMPLLCRAVVASATATIWSSAALRRPMAAAKPWSQQPACRRKWGESPGCWMRRRINAAAARARQDRQAARDCRNRDRHRDDCDDCRCRRDTRARGIVRRADSRRRPAVAAVRRSTCRGHGGTGARRATNGAPQCDRAAPGRRRDAGVGKRDRFRQDGHADEERDDRTGPITASGRVDFDGVGYSPVGAMRAGGRRRDRWPAARRGQPRARGGRPRQQRRSPRTRWALDGAGRPDGSCPDRCRAQGRNGSGSARRTLRARRRGAVLLRAEAHEHRAHRRQTRGDVARLSRKALQTYCLRAAPTSRSARSDGR